MLPASGDCDGPHVSSCFEDLRPCRNYNACDGHALHGRQCRIRVRSVLGLSLRYTVDVFKLQHEPQRDCGAGNITAAGSIIEALSDVAPSISLTAFGRQMMLDEFAHVGERL